MKRKEINSYDIICGAIELIERCGWIRKEFGDDDKGYCIVGALEKVRIDLRATKEPYIQALDKVKESIGKSSIPYWNDYFAKDKKNVLQKLKKTRKRLRIDLGIERPPDEK